MEVCFILEENNLSEITRCALSSEKTGTLPDSQFVTHFSQIRCFILLTRSEL